MSTKKSDFNIPESQDKSKNKTKKTPATLDDVVKAVDKVSKNISDIPSDIKSTITKNNKDQEQITNGKLKTITDKISEQNKNIQNLIKEINKIKSSGTSSSKGTSTNKNDNTKSSNFRDLSKEEQQRLNKEQEYQKKLDAHEKKVAEIAKINAQTTQIQEATAKSYELFLTQNKKALDDLVFFNKKSDLEISKKTEELKYISEKNAKSLLEMEAESQRKNDKHNAWKEDRSYFLGKTNKKAKDNNKSTGFMKSVKDFFTLNDKNTDNRTNSSNDNNADKISKLSASDIIKVEVVKLPIESLSALNTLNNQSNFNTDNSFTSIAKNFQDKLSEIENKVREGAKGNNKDNQKLVLNQVKIDKQLQDNTAARIKAETDNSIKLAKESREKQKFEIDTKLKQQTLEQNKRKFDIDEQDKLFKMARDLEKHTAWQEDRAYDLEKRKKADKEVYKDSYKESTTYRAIDSVKNAHSGFGTSVAMSALTGGFVNPAIINALKLDKLMMAPLEALGKSLLRSKKKTKDSSSNLGELKSFNSNVNEKLVNLVDSFESSKNLNSEKLDKLIELVEDLPSRFNSDEKKNPSKKELKEVNQIGNTIRKAKTDKQVITIKPTPNTQNTTTSAIKNSKTQPLMSKLDTIVQKLTNLDKPKEVGTTEKKKKGLFEKLGDLFGSLGGLASGLGVAGIAMLIKHLFPKTMKALNDKFMGFLTDKVGLSESTAQGVDQLVTDALPGAIAGFTVGGFKGALIGAGLSMAGMFIKHKWDEWHGDANKDEKPAKIGPFDANTVQAVLSGAIIGGAFGLKGAAWGAAIGLGAQTLLKTVEDWKNIFTGEQQVDNTLGDYFAGAFTGAMSGMALSGGKFDKKRIITGAAMGLMIPYVTQQVNDWKNILTGKSDVNNTLGDYFAGALTGATSAMALSSGKFDKKKILMGAAIGIAIPWVTQQVNDWKNILSGKGVKADAKKLGDEILSGAIGGALMGAPSPMGMAIGAVIGAALPLIKSLAGDWEGTIKILKNGLASIAEFGKNLIAHPIDTFKKLFGIGKDEENAVGQAYEEGKNEYNNQSSSPAVTEAIKEEYNKDINIENNTEGIVVKEEKIKQNEALAKNVAVNTNDSLININAESDNNLLKDTIFNTQKPMGLTETIEAQVNGNIQDNKAEEQAKGVAEKTNENIAIIEKEEQAFGEEKAGGGYGKIGQSNNKFKNELSNRSEKYGINPILLEDMSLHGTIDRPWTGSGNSIPAISEKNKDSLKKLDEKLHEWGYNFTYTSAMGGHKYGTNHWKGNKVDLQIKTNRYPARMTPGQEQALIEAGYAKNGTGALGWESHENQVGGGHYDLYLGDGDVLQNITPNDSINYAELGTGNVELGDLADLGTSTLANKFSSGINDFYNLLSFMAGGEGYGSSAGSVEKLDTIGPAESTNSAVDMASSGSSAPSMSSNASKEVQKLDTATIPSTEMANTNELAQLNSSISGNGNNGSDSLANIMTNVAENTANASQNNSAPIIYNNTTTQSSDNDDSVYPVGDLAKTLLYA